MIELTTVNGFRRLVNVKGIASISELKGNSGSNAVVVLESGETIFVADTYEDIKAQVLCTGGNGE
ncbi:hypothetical protein vBBceSLY1_00054 [Bacillus phage vB_BceS_LY1]|uniref:Uncharacterized protein n=1 Tax=Bacillus phage vB_BceS_LY1 TaxID=2950459 RepID=A0AAE9LV36_9CAUD|nr:hypothetical protein vBBceSLY1_00054 [Bacillus phage vB_BceS_LY1]